LLDARIGVSDPEPWNMPARSLIARLLLGLPGWRNPDIAQTFRLEKPAVVPVFQRIERPFVLLEYGAL
jgi:hypothetical protein